MPKKNLLHDSHLHLDILLEQLGLEQEVRKGGFRESLNQESVAKIDELLAKHELVMHATVDWQNYRQVYQWFTSNPKVHFLLGSHPEIVTEDFDLEKYLSEQKEYLDENLENLEIDGIGEIGLDYYYTQDEKLIDTQKALFRSQIELALELQQPIVIHCRDAFEDAFAILREYPAIHNNFLVHCFTGGIKEAEEIINMGGKLGIGGIVTFKNGQSIRDVITHFNIDDIIVETDLPFLAPVPKRGEVCLPEYIEYIIQTIADLKDMSFDQVLAYSKHNCLELFPGLRKKLGKRAYISDETIEEHDSMEDI